MAAPVGAEPTVQTGASIDKFFGVFWTWSVMRFRVCARVWDRFFLSASLRLLPVPLVRAFAVPQGRVFVDCSAVERIARGNRALPCFSSCPTGLRLNISRLSFLTAISLKLWLKSYLWKSEI